MKILMHICCGPCGIYPVHSLRKEGFEVIGFFSNPNIHPYREYALRLEGAQQMAEHLALPLKVDSYHPEQYFREVAFHEEERCRHCYELRLRRTAAAAIELGCDGYTTSLLVSPMQRHDTIYQVGELIGHETNVPFLYYDWRRGFSEGRREAKAMGLYRQQYCGCLFSERERYDQSCQRASAVLKQTITGERGQQKVVGDG